MTNNICANRIFNVTETKGKDWNFRYILLSYNLRNGRKVHRKNLEECRGFEKPGGRGGSRKAGEERGRARRARGVMKSEDTWNGDEIAEWKRVSDGGSRDNYGRKMSPACSNGGDEPGFLKFRTSAELHRVQGGWCGTCANALSCARPSFLLLQKDRGLIKCSSSDVGYRRETYYAWVLSSRKRILRIYSRWYLRAYTTPRIRKRSQKSFTSVIDLCALYNCDIMAWNNIWNADRFRVITWTISYQYFRTMTVNQSVPWKFWK